MVNRTMRNIGAAGMGQPLPEISLQFSKCPCGVQPIKNDKEA
jgi:hypothetical protein